MNADAQRIKAWIQRHGRVPLLAAAGFIAGLVMVYAALALLPAGGADDLNRIESASGAAAPAAQAPQADKAPKRKGLFASDKDKGPKTPPPSVRVAQAQQKNVAPEMTSVGNVIPNQSVALTARINSQITDVKFNAGDDVKAGQVLFMLDEREIKALVAQVRARLAGNQAQLVAYKKELDRQQLGVDKGFASKSALDLAQAQYAAGAALVESTQAELDVLEAQATYSTVTAPIDGRTGTINFTVGNIVRANDTVPLVVINQIKPIAVQAALPQTSIDAVRRALAGGIVNASATTSGNKKVSGRLQYIDNAIDPATGTYTVRALFDNEDETLYPGTLVNLTVALGQDKPQITVPEVAVQHNQKGEAFVYVIDAQNIAHITPVTIARIQDGMAIVAEGLSGTETVATDGMMSIKDGGPVSIDTASETAEEILDTPDEP